MTGVAPEGPHDQLIDHTQKEDPAHHTLSVSINSRDIASAKAAGVE